MKQKTKTYVVLAVSLILLGMVAGAYFFAFTWLKKKSEYISQMKSELKSATEEEKEQEKLRQVIAETEADRTRLEAIFVPGDQAVTFLETLEGYAVTAGAKLKFTTVDYDKATSSFKMVFNIEGSFADVHHTIKLLEYAPYELAFDRITLARRDNVVTPALAADPKTVSSAPNWRADVSMQLISFTPTE